MYGYRQVDGRLEIVPEEAGILRMAADLYLEGYGGERLKRVLAKAGICGRHGNEMTGHSIVNLLCNEKSAGNLLLQKKYVTDPLTKLERINRGELPQYFVEGSHKPILDGDTYSRILAERARRAARYHPNPQTPPTYPFTGRISCGKCGGYFRRKIAGAPGYKKPVWICNTFNSKGKAFCASKQIPEAILENVAAQAMGLPVFQASAFTERIKEIRVPENGTLIFVFFDGHESSLTWKNASRRDSWDEQARQKARDLALRRAAERRTVLCRQ